MSFSPGRSLIVKKLAKKLTLNRETVRHLSREEVSQVAGGGAALATGRTNEPFCVSNAVTCDDSACYVNA